MLSFHIKFVQTDRRTDNGKTICPLIFRYGGIKTLYKIKFSLYTYASAASENLLSRSLH